MTEADGPAVSVIAFLVFEFVSDFVLRISDLVNEVAM